MDERGDEQEIACQNGERKDERAHETAPEGGERPRSDAPRAVGSDGPAERASDQQHQEAETGHDACLRGNCRDDTAHQAHETDTQADCRALGPNGRLAVRRILVSLALKTTTQSIIVSKLSAHPRRSKTLRALWEYDNIIRSLYLLDFIDSPPLRQNVQRALNRGENYHQLRRAVSYANLGKLRFRTEEEQQIWSECSRLLANCVIYFNASILSELVAYYLALGDMETVALITQVSPVAWQNTNFYGHYEFTKRPAAIDLALLVQELTQQPLPPASDSP